MDIILKISLASILGGLIGLEREAINRPAGFRTHILVAIGSALIMLVSLEMGKHGGDPARIAAQVISGIGFLGAGTILRTGNNIEGLTTAASLWLCAGIGIATGSGYYIGAVFTTIVALFFLKNAKVFEKILKKTSFKDFVIIGHTRPGLIGDIGTIFGEYHITIKDISILSLEIEDVLKEELHFTVKLPHNINIDSLFDDLLSIDGVNKLMVDKEEINTKNE